MSTNRHESKIQWAAKGQRAQVSRSSSSILRKIVRSNSGSQIVPMMQTAQPRHCYDSATRLRVTRCRATGRRSLRQRKMRAVLVIITDVLVHEAFQMPFVENDHMVEQISAAVPDPSLRNAVLPRASEAGLLGLDAEALHRLNHFAIELGAAIEDQIARRGVVRERFPQLLNNPNTGRMPGHIAVQDAPPVMRNDEEAVQNAEGERGHREEVHCGNRFAMVVQKSRPSLCRLRIARCFSHPAQHGSLRNIEAKHPHLTVNARRAPGGVVNDHAENEFAQFLADALSSRTVPMPRKPRPVELEPHPMPADNGRRLDEDQCSLPSRPKPPQHYPEHLVGYGKPRLRVPLFQNGKLLPKGQVFQEKVAARAAKPNKKIEQQLERTEHEPVVAESLRISMQNLQRRGSENALHLRSVYRITTAFHGLRCHPLTCMLLKIHLTVDSSLMLAASTS